MESNESSEMYLEAILELASDGTAVRSVDIANFLGVTKPSVNRAMNKLKEEGCIVQERYGSVTFTEKGRERASAIHHTHHIITDFLCRTLGLNIAAAEEDACRIEHVISPDTVAAMKRYLNQHPEKP